MPGTELEAVIPAVRLPRSRAEVPVIVPRTRRFVLVVARRRARDRTEPPPRSAVRLDEVGVLALLVLVVSEREDGRIAARREQIRGRELPALEPRSSSALIRRARRITRDVAGGSDRDSRGDASLACRRNEPGCRGDDDRGDEDGARQLPDAASPSRAASTSFAGATSAYASSAIPAISSQFSARSSRMPSHPRCPT